MTVKRLTMWGWVIVGGIIFIVAVPLTISPIPFGAPLLVLGLFMMSTHPYVLRLLRRARSKFPAFSQKLRNITPMMPEFLAKFLRRTDSSARKNRFPRLRKKTEDADTKGDTK